MYDGKNVGHFCVDSSKILVQFYIFNEYLIYASEIFLHIITSDIIETASVSTKESIFLGLCLDYQKSVSVDMYIFSDNRKVKYKLKGFNNTVFRLATKCDIDAIKNKCDPAFEGYYEDLITNDQLFVLYEEDTLLGIGEFRIIKAHNQYGDIGMVVVEEYRRKGIGTYIITQLKEHCYKNNLKPMACCNSKNLASKNTLEKSGFINIHRIVNICFK